MIDTENISSKSTTGRGEDFDRRRDKVTEEMARKVEETSLLGFEFTQKGFEQRAQNLYKAVLAMVGKHTEGVGGKKVVISYEEYAQINEFAYQANLTPKFAEASGVIRVSNPALITTEEEFLHAAEEIVRKSLTFYTMNFSDSTNEYVPVDPRIREVLSTTVHAAVLIDALLTLSALELGSRIFLQLSDSARQETLKNAPRPPESASMMGLLGSPLNERFQYPTVTESCLQLYIEAVQQDFDSLILVLNQKGTVIKEREEIFELFVRLMNPYGSDFLDLVLRAIDAPDIKHLINMGKTYIENCLKDPSGKSLEDLVRHHKPITDEQREFAQRKLYNFFQVPDTGTLYLIAKRRRAERVYPELYKKD